MFLEELRRKGQSTSELSRSCLGDRYGETISNEGPTFRQDRGALPLPPQSAQNALCADKHPQDAQLAPARDTAQRPIKGRLRALTIDNQGLAPDFNNSLGRNK